MLCDPQTSGGLLVAVDPAAREEVLQLFAKYNLDLQPLGVLKDREANEKLIKVL